jgi:hypothetical protein
MESGLLKGIGESIKLDIDHYFAEKAATTFRKHLGASKIGDACGRKLWYEFRHADRPINRSTRPQGQVERVFERGHREEPYIISYLKACGHELENTPENQIRISDCGGHFGGSVDNVGYLPKQFGVPEKILYEFKTSNSAEFLKLTKNDVRSVKPMHYSQICAYGYKLDLNYCLYICVDKNTEDLYVELVAIDKSYGKSMIDKAALIITSGTPLPKISLSASHFSCKWCSLADVCHNGKVMDRNCRTCIHSMTLQDGKWGCKLANCEIPEEIQVTGCNSYNQIRG